MVVLNKMAIPAIVAFGAVRGITAITAITVIRTIVAMTAIAVMMTICDITILNDTECEILSKLVNMYRLQLLSSVHMVCKSHTRLQHVQEHVIFLVCTFVI